MIAARDNSPAAKAGLRTGDYIRAINDLPTREMSVWEGTRVLRGAAGTKVTLTVIRGNAADPHVVELVREAGPPSVVTGRIAAPGVGYMRIAGDLTETAEQVKAHVADAVEERRDETDRRRAAHVERLARRRPRDGAAVRRQGHAGDARDEKRAARDDREPTPATDPSRCRPSS